MQPIIYYFSAATSTDAVPFLTAMFTAANIWSMLLFVGEQPKQQPQQQWIQQQRKHQSLQQLQHKQYHESCGAVSVTALYLSQSVYINGS